LQGQVQLKNPQHKFWLIEIDGQVVNNGLPPLEGKHMYFAREIGAGDRSLVSKYELSRRKYLGPTAMDAEIALLMVTQALVQPGQLVYDPFVGTGSILIAAAHFGALTMVGVVILLKIVWCDQLGCNLASL
jgi:tRNA (guanine10-N2)-methyltransferase